MTNFKHLAIDLTIAAIVTAVIGWSATSSRPQPLNQPASNPSRMAQPNAVQIVSAAVDASISARQRQ